MAKQQKNNKAETNNPSNKLDYCSSCGEEKEVSRYFYKSNNPAHKGHTLICKSCIKIKIYRDDGKIDKQQMKDTLKEMDLPWFEDTYQKALNDDSETFGVYVRMLNPIAKAKGKKFLTWNDGETSENQKNKDNNTINIEVNPDFKITPQMVKFWGEYSPEDYEFLEEYYSDLIKIYDHSLPVQINNYKNMAKTQLQANKSLANSDIPSYEKAMKILSLLSGDSNIKPVQETSAGNIDKGSFGVFIKKIEDEEPIPRWVEDLGNEDKLDKYIRTFFFGNLAKVLNIRNPWQTEFDEEMKQFTVDKSDAEEENNIQDFLGEN